MKASHGIELIRELNNPIEHYGLGNFTIQYKGVSNPVGFNTILGTKN